MHNMTAYRQLRIYLYFLLALLTSGCQLAAPDGPGFNFALFQDTRAAGLARAVESEDTALIRKYVVTDAIPIDIREPTFGNTLLFLSVVDNKERSTKQLLDLGANPNETGFDGTSPFLAACHYQWRITHPQQVLQLLIDKGADVNSVQIDTTNNQFGKKQHYHVTALQLVCVNGGLPGVKLVVEQRASLSAYGENSKALLTTATLTGNLDILKYLMIDKKAPIPDHIFIRQPDTKHEKILRISDVLNEHDYSKKPHDQSLKEEILAYLKSQGKQ
jgi:hypothetical protein